LRAIAIDDWSWRKGFRYGTIVVDLERRTVADVLKTRSAHGTADWLKQHPDIELVSRDRCGLYAYGIRKGPPSARQVADRFHLIQNLRENIEQEMTSVSRCAGRPRLPALAGDRREVVTPPKPVFPPHPVRQRQTDARGRQDLRRYRR
jgi:transposase